MARFFVVGPRHPLLMTENSESRSEHAPQETDEYKVWSGCEFFRVGNGAGGGRLILDLVVTVELFKRESLQILQM